MINYHPWKQHFAQTILKPKSSAEIFKITWRWFWKSKIAWGHFNKSFWHIFFIFFKFIFLLSLTFNKAWLIMQCVAFTSFMMLLIIHGLSINTKSHDVIFETRSIWLKLNSGRRIPLSFRGQLERYHSPLVQFQQNTPRLNLYSGYFAQNPLDNLKNCFEGFESIYFSFQKLHRAISYKNWDFWENLSFEDWL